MGVQTGKRRETRAELEARAHEMEMARDRLSTDVARLCNALSKADARARREAESASQAEAQFDAMQKKWQRTQAMLEEERATSRRLSERVDTRADGARYEHEQAEQHAERMTKATQLAARALAVAMGHDGADG